MTTLPSLLRAASAAVLLAIAVDLVRSPAQDTTVLQAAPDAGAALARALVAPDPPDRIVLEGPTGVSAATALLLAPGPATPALTLPVGPLPSLRATAPERPTAGRATAIDVAVRGRAGDSVVVRWRGAVGGGDSTTVALSEEGTAGVGLGVRPTRAGWQSWSVSSGSDTVAVGAWARPDRPLRVRALVGTPDAESRYALRALEEAGIEVDAILDLGRVDIDPAGDDPPLTGPGGPDVVVLMRDPELDAGTRTGLAAFVAAGGGVVVAPAAEGAPDAAIRPLLAGWGLGDGAAPGATLASGDSVSWSLPAALSPLPPAPAPVRIATRTSEVPARAAGRVDGRPVALLSTPGPGRVAWTGIAESWRWRMEGGAVEAHRAWWRGLVEWAASGVREPIVAHLPTVVAPRTVVDVRLEAVRPEDASWPDTIEVARPDGRAERLPVVVVRREPAASHPGSARQARFLADAPGVYLVSWNGEAEIGLTVDADLPTSDPAELSLLALASGSAGAPGLPLPPSGGPASSDLGSARPWSPDGHRPLRPWTAYALAALLLAEWVLRRRAGGP